MQNAVSRRQALSKAGLGLGGLALAGVLGGIGVKSAIANAGNAGAK